MKDLIDRKMVKLSALTRKILVEHTDLNTRFTEIILLGYCNNETASKHLSRYIFTSKLVHGIVLDCASGSCYGSSILKKNNAVNVVISVDINRDLLIYGKIVYNADCVCAEATHLPFRRDIFDSVVSIETLEHLKNPDEFMTSIKACLKDGELILSTPNKLHLSPSLPKPLNPYHMKEYYLGSLLTFLKSHSFKVINAYGGRKVGRLELIRRIFASLLKFLLSKFSLNQLLIDNLYHSIYNKLIVNSKSIISVDPDPRYFPHTKLKTTSNIILFQYFLIHTYVQK